MKTYTAANWNVTNPILEIGEEGHETDTGKMKIGDGASNWIALDYVYFDGVNRLISTNTSVESSSRTLNSDDVYHVICNISENNLSFTIPTDTTYNYENLSTIFFSQLGTGSITIVGETGVTIHTRIEATTTTSGSYALCAITKISANEWRLSGSLALK